MPARLAAALLTLAVLLASPASAQPSDFDLQAHRGGRGETTEESLRAFAKAIELGVSTLELDIAITKDGQPLVWHDPTIDAEKCVDTEPAFAGDPLYPYVGKLVHELTLVQLRTLDCGRRLAEFPRAEVVRDNKIATLPEVFALADSYRRRRALQHRNQGGGRQARQVGRTSGVRRRDTGRGQVRGQGRSRGD